MKEMYKGKVNSPATLLVETIDSSVTSIKVVDGTVFPEGPNLAVIGTDAQAETIKYANINNNILVGCVRGFQGAAKSWDKDSIIARNFTEYDLDAIQENILELDLNKVEKVENKSLSSNDFTDDLKNKLENIEDGANKVTKLSQLTNDKTFKTEAEIQSMIEKASALKKEVVTSLPTTGKDDVIYLVKDDKGKENNNYLEYLWLNGKYELIGSTQVDLSGYMKTKDFQPKWESIRRTCTNFDRKITGVENKIPEKFDIFSGEDPGENDKSYVTPAYVERLYLGKQELNSIDTKFKELSNSKVEKVEGKGLSTNDFTNDDMRKLANFIVPSDYDSRLNFDDFKNGVYFGFASAKNLLLEDDRLSFIDPDLNNMSFFALIANSYYQRLVIYSELISYIRLYDENNKKWGAWGKVYHLDDLNQLQSLSPVLNQVVQTLDGKISEKASAKNLSGLLIEFMNHKKKTDKLKEQVILTESEYNALSTSQKDDPNKIYFIKE